MRSLDVILYDPCDTTQAIVKKTIYIPDVAVVGDSYNSSVNQNATQTFNFRSIDAQCIVYSGSR